MTEPEFLEFDVVMVLHAQALREYGGRQGLRDENLLLSALGRAADKLAYGDPETADLYVLAAAYAFGLARNHPFVDGNKRTAWSCCALFLKLNQAAAPGDKIETIEQMVRLAEGQVEEADFADWLRSRRA